MAVTFGILRMLRMRDMMCFSLHSDTGYAVGQDFSWHSYGVFKTTNAGTSWDDLD